MAWERYKTRHGRGRADHVSGGCRINGASAANIVAPFLGLILRHGTIQTRSSKTAVIGLSRPPHATEALTLFPYMEETSTTPPFKMQQSSFLCHCIDGWHRCINGIGPFLSYLHILFPACSAKNKWQMQCIALSIQLSDFDLAHHPNDT